jgi:TetR/AcrR family transcriptional regulator
MDLNGNRDRLLEISLSLFARKGYDAVGVQEIVSAAGVTKPTLYHYFESKRGLLEAVLERDGAVLRRGFAEWCRYERDLTATLSHIASGLVDFARTHRDYYRLLLGLTFAPSESEAFQASLPLFQRCQELLEGLFQQAIAEHGNMRGRHRAYAASFFAILNSYIGFFLNGHAELDEGTLHRALHQFEHGIYS